MVTRSQGCLSSCRECTGQPTGGGTLVLSQVWAGRCSALGLAPKAPPVRAGVLYRKGVHPANRVEDTALTRALRPLFWAGQ